MARQLARDVAQLNVRLAGTPVQKLSQDESCINVAIDRDQQQRTRLSIYYLDADSYPRGACIVSTEDEAVEGQVQQVNEKHSASCRLEDVLASIAFVLGIDCPALQGGAVPDAEAANDAVDMDDDDEEGEDEQDDEYEEEVYDMAEDDDQDVTATILKKLTRWTQLEETLTPPKPDSDDEEAAGEKPAEAAMTLEEKEAAKRQLFNPKEAFQMLSKELMDIMRGAESWLTADAVGDDVYKWGVWISEADAGPPLGKDLAELEQRTGDGRIHLQLSFKRGLHPFFPPAVQVIGPRFQGPLAGALASHPMLLLKNWDPWRPVKELVAHLRTFMELVGRVDLPATLASISAGEDAAYSEVEACLARMEALTGARPACAAEHSGMYSVRDAGVDEARMEALKPVNKRAKTEPKQRAAWAAGTGYGMGHRAAAGEVWDSRAAVAAQAAHDAELQGLASRLAELLAAQFGTASGSSAQPICLDSTNSGAAGCAAGSAVSRDPLAAVGQSCLIPVLMRELTNATFTDMSNRAAYYEALLQVLLQLASHPPAARLFVRPHNLTDGSPTRDARSVMADMRQQADHFLRIFVPGPNEAGAGPSSAAASSVTAKLAEEQRQEEATTLRLAHLIVDAASRVAAIVGGLETEAAAQPAAAPAAAAATGGSRQGSRTRGSTAAAAAASATRPPETTGDVDTAYQHAMKKWQVDMVTGLAANHLYKKQADSEAVAPRPRMVRVGKELASLMATLPLNHSSSVFVRVDEGNLVLWRAMITGPSDTPYSHGAFIFDMYFPPTYPQVPPQVLLRTTGGGRVRFNPNLYNCGKVCLSLLGTWSGDRGESWDSNVSSMLQVLVSIQSLILVDDPYFNEPGFESSMHTDSGRQQSRAYSANIMEQTMHYAIEEQLRAPVEEFRDVIRDHFRLQREDVVRTCTQWISQTAEHDSGRAKRMTSCLANIQKLLAAL